MAGQWYYKAMGQEAGPVSPAELKALAESGFLAPDVLVRKGADRDWIPASQVRGLLEGTFEPEAADPSQAPPANARRPAAAIGDGGVPSAQAAIRPAPPASEGSWYCQVMGEETGPLSSAQLKELAASGFLTPDVPVRKGINGSWVPASRVKGLFPGAPQSPGAGTIESPAASRPDSKPSGWSDPVNQTGGAPAKPAAPRSPSAQIGWYYQATGEETGPLSSADLKELARSGLLTPDMPVRMGTDGDWLPAGQVLGLFDEPSR